MCGSEKVAGEEPEDDRGDRAVGAGSGLQETCSEEGADGPGPVGALGGERGHGDLLLVGHPLVFVVVVTAMGQVLVEAFENLGVEDGRADLVVARGPFAEVEDAAAVGAEGEVFAGGEDDLAADGAEERFGGGCHTASF